jgi:hypothetical protein
MNRRHVMTMLAILGSEGLLHAAQLPPSRGACAPEAPDGVENRRERAEHFDDLGAHRGFWVVPEFLTYSFRRLDCTCNRAPHKSVRREAIVGTRRSCESFKTAHLQLNAVKDPGPTSLSRFHRELFSCSPEKSLCSWKSARSHVQAAKNPNAVSPWLIPGGRRRDIPLPIRTVRPRTARSRHRHSD